MGNSRSTKSSGTTGEAVSVYFYCVKNREDIFVCFALSVTTL